MHPDELLEQLKKTANIRKQRNLEIIHSICREQFERGSKDFSVATIARMSEERNGPVKGSIHNKTGDDFKGLINAWAQQTGGVTRKIRKISENPYEALIEKIENPALRSMMSGILAENRKLKRENNLLKSETDRILDLRPQPKVEPTDLAQIISASAFLLPSETEALCHAVSEKFLAEQGWKCDDNGRITNNIGRQIYKVGYATAIRKLTSEAQNEP